MKGYIAVIERRSASHFEVVFPDLEGCRSKGVSVEDALHQAERAARHHLGEMRRLGRCLPRRRPAWHMLREARRRGAVAALCLDPRP